MAITYANFFDKARAICSLIKLADTHKDELATKMETAAAELDDDENLDDIVNRCEKWLTQIDTQRASIVTILENFIKNKGRKVIESGKVSAEDISADLVEKMERDNQSVPESTFSAAASYLRDGNGTIASYTQTNRTNNDDIDFICTVGQDASTDAVFGTIKSRQQGELDGTVTADSKTKHTFSSIGIEDLILSAGTGGAAATASITNNSGMTVTALERGTAGNSIRFRLQNAQDEGTHADGVMSANSPLYLYCNSAGAGGNSAVLNLIGSASEHLSVSDWRIDYFYNSGTTDLSTLAGDINLSTAAVAIMSANAGATGAQVVVAESDFVLTGGLYSTVVNVQNDDLEIKFDGSDATLTKEDIETSANADTSFAAKATMTINPANDDDQPADNSSYDTLSGGADGDWKEGDQATLTTVASSEEYFVKIWRDHFDVGLMTSAIPTISAVP